MAKNRSGSAGGRNPARSSGGPKRGTRGDSPPETRADSYEHPEAEIANRPDIGTQAGFRKKRAARNYKYDSSLAPALDWDGANAAREIGEALIRRILEARTIEDAKSAAEELARMSRPFLDWSGKAERL